MKKTMPAELGQGTSCPLTLTDSGRQLSDRQTLGLEHLALQWRRPSPLPDLLPIRTQTWQTHACTHSHTHAHTCACMDTCTHAFMHAHICNTCTHTCKCANTRTHAHTCIHAHLSHMHMWCTHAHMCTRVHACTCTHACPYMHLQHTYTHVHIYIHVHTHMHTCMCAHMRTGIIAHLNTHAHAHLHAHLQHTQPIACSLPLSVSPRIPGVPPSPTHLVRPSPGQGGERPLFSLRSMSTPAALGTRPQGQYT